MNKSNFLTPAFVWISIAVYLIISLIYGFASIDTWDDDCPTRYYNTVNAFNEPIHFVSLWNRPLFTLIFAIPLQFGKFMIPILMVLITAVSTFYLYKALKKQGVQNAAMVVPFLLFQTYFFGISRNAETEPLAVAIFCLGYYFMVKKKWFWFALMAGLLPLARLELSVLFPFWAWVLLKEKKLKYILVMMIPLFLWNLAGGIITGDFAYLFEKTVGADNEKNRYGHTSFGHYFQRYIYAVGPLFFFFFGLGLLKMLFSKITHKGFVLFQFAVGFFVYVLFSWKLNMGNAAGFMRNLTPLSALAAVIGLYGFNYWLDILKVKFKTSEIKGDLPHFEFLSDEEFDQLNRKKRQAYLNSKSKYESKIAKLKKKAERANQQQRRRALLKYVLFGFTILTLVIITKLYFTLEIRNHHKLLEDTEYNLNLYLVLALVGLTLILFIWSRFKTLSSIVPMSIVAIGIIMFTSYTEPPNTELTEERAMMTKISDTFQHDLILDKTKYVNHIWFYWANDLDKFSEEYKGVTMQNLDSAEVGSICVWENHYSHRLSGDVKPEYFSKHPEWVRVSYYVGNSTGFRAVIYEKIDIAKKDAGQEAILNYAKVDSTHSDTYICLGTFLKARAESKNEAFIYFNKAIEIDSLNHNAWFNRGIAQFEKRELRKAKQDFRKTIEIKPKWSDAWVNLGAAHSNLGEIDSSIFAYSKAIEYKDKKGSAYRNRGKMYEAKKDTMAALGDYSNYLKIQKNDYTILWQRARLYAGLSSWKAAVSDLNRIVKLRPEIKDAWLLLGVGYYELKNKDESKKALLRAKELGHPNADVYIAKYFSQELK
ncbi:tetratricopeptide repeat protein [Crocinitomix algicola]|uniref:tetratricopeptide repeat protein n=1 Tax=Crocinitomix algicola TaxID=1740263 RepID=UPI000872DD36|nr:tetratricopeptide repeat protein [Crocinitomix algicola]